jgi:hypothetical protein
MSSANIINRKIRPTHPGEMLREDFMPDYGLAILLLIVRRYPSIYSIHPLDRDPGTISTKPRTLFEKRGLSSPYITSAAG